MSSWFSNLMQIPQQHVITMGADIRGALWNKSLNMSRDASLGQTEGPHKDCVFAVIVAKCEAIDWSHGTGLNIDKDECRMRPF